MNHLSNFKYQSNQHQITKVILIYLILSIPNNFKYQLKLILSLEFLINYMKFLLMVLILLFHLIFHF